MKCTNAYYHWVTKDRAERAVLFKWNERKGRKRSRPLEVQTEAEDHKPQVVEKVAKKDGFFRRALRRVAANLFAY